MSKDVLIAPSVIEMLHALRNSIAKELTDAEFQLFVEICKTTGLNPLTKEMWAIKANGRLQLMTGINGFLRIANSHPQFDGMEVTNEFDGKNLVACTVKVHRKDRKYPSVATAYMHEYAKPSPIWKQMPSVMLAKCAKSLAIREAFIQELGGLYTQEEMPSEYASHNVKSVTVLPVSETQEVSCDRETGEVKASSDELPWESAPLKESPKKTKAIKTRYDVSGLEGNKLEIAEAYLTSSSCKQIGDGLWECPIRLEKLTTCIVD